MILKIIQIASGALIIITILLQQRGTSSGSMFGGSSDGAFYQTRRGIEKGLLISTIVLGCIFFGSAILSIVQ